MAHEVPKGPWLVAFSLAGEERDLVRRIAEEVERQLGESTVFFDEWYDWFIAGDDADLKLQRVYSDRAELVVICVSGSYGSKPWTRAEHRAIRARYMQASNDDDEMRILPLRVGPGDVEGILFNSVVPPVTEDTPAKAAQKIISRLRQVSRTSLGPELTRFEWPQRLPDHYWPIADHVEAQTGFRTLLSRDSPYSLMPVKGVSETGKTTLSKEMECYVAEHLPDLRCGRFDFKGAADRDLEVKAFAQSLDLNVPDQLGGGDVLMGTLSQLLHLSEPTILIFDTYEEAGDAQKSIERLFFPQLRKADWLRVVVLGQHIPTGGGTVWASVVAPPIELTPPEPQAWFEYARICRPEEDLELEFVTRVHKAVAGKSSLLAGVCGPQ